MLINLIAIILMTIILMMLLMVFPTVSFFIIKIGLPQGIGDMLVVCVCTRAEH